MDNKKMNTEDSGVGSEQATMSEIFVLLEEDSSFSDEDKIPSSQPSATLPMHGVGEPEYTSSLDVEPGSDRTDIESTQPMNPLNIDEIDEIVVRPRKRTKRNIFIDDECDDDDDELDNGEYVEREAPDPPAVASLRAEMEKRLEARRPPDFEALERRFGGNDFTPSQAETELAGLVTPEKNSDDKQVVTPTRNNEWTPNKNTGHPLYDPLFDILQDPSVLKEWKRDIFFVFFVQKCKKVEEYSFTDQTYKDTFVKLGIKGLLMIDFKDDYLDLGAQMCLVHMHKRSGHRALISALFEQGVRKPKVRTYYCLSKMRPQLADWLLKNPFKYEELTHDCGLKQVAGDYYMNTYFAYGDPMPCPLVVLTRKDETPFSVALLTNFAIDNEVIRQGDLLYRYSRIARHAYSVLHNEVGTPQWRKKILAKDLGEEQKYAELCGCGCKSNKFHHESNAANARLFYSRTDQEKLCKQACIHAMNEHLASVANKQNHEYVAEWWRFFEADSDIDEFDHWKKVEMYNKMYMKPGTIRDTLWKTNDGARIAASKVFYLFNFLCSPDSLSWKDRVLVVSGASGSGKTTMVNIVRKIFGPEHVQNISLEGKQEGSLQFVLGECYNKKVVIIDDLMCDGWKICIEQMRNHFDGNEVQFNRKYGRVQTGVFPRTIITTNLTQQGVYDLYPNVSMNVQIVDISMRRMKRWMFLYPINEAREFGPATSEYHQFMMLKFMMRNFFGTPPTKITEVKKFFEAMGKSNKSVFVKMCFDETEYLDNVHELYERCVPVERSYWTNASNVLNAMCESGKKALEKDSVSHLWTQELLDEVNTVRQSVDHVSESDDAEALAYQFEYVRRKAERILMGDLFSNAV